MREARLRPEFAHLYSGLMPGQWESAARIAEAVLANVVLQEMAESSAVGRVLPEEHFEFRGGESTPRGGKRRTVADGS
jgi:hypothetical protein